MLAVWHGFFRARADFNESKPIALSVYNQLFTVNETVHGVALAQLASVI
jgi:hypothetical protein